MYFAACLLTAIKHIRKQQWWWILHWAFTSLNRHTGGVITNCRCRTFPTRFLFCLTRSNLSGGLTQSRAIYEGLSLWVSHRSDAAAAPSCIEAPTATARALPRFRAPHTPSRNTGGICRCCGGGEASRVGVPVLACGVWPLCGAS